MSIDLAQKATGLFNLPARVPDGFRMGRGIIRLITVAVANTDIAIAHTLGRVPSFILVLDPGTNYVDWRRSSVTAWTQKAISVQFSGTGAIKIWIV